MIQSQTIHILSENVANQIAAGEVVERPASVVKELVENSLDAGARAITVAVTDGGRALVQVIDDGIGMGEADIELAVERFATSKISNAQELLQIRTFGFRGEALPSIASVSRFCLESSRGDGGGEITIAGGNRIKFCIKHRCRGTTITVRDLFYNVPARRSFLRSEKVELSQIKMILSDFAAAHSEVRFVLISDGCEILTLPARASESSFSAFRDRVQELDIVSQDALECSSHIETASGSYQLQAILSKPLDSVVGASRLRFIVNGRAVRDRLLLSAVRESYGNLLRPGRYPAGILKLTVPCSDLDVNVHPQKTEVRYRCPDRIFSTLRQGIGVALQSESTGSLVNRAFIEKHQEHTNQGMHLHAVGFNFSSPSPLNLVSTGLRLEKPRPLTEYRFVGQIFNCYLLLESDSDQFAIVDMHAAHERVTFARLKKQWADGEIVTQGLLLPESVTVPMHIRAEIPRILEILEALSFEVEQLSEDCLVVRAVPALLSRLPPGNLLSEILSGLSSMEIEGALERRVDGVISRIACHGSVRSGQRLAESEVYQLLEDLESVELKAFCPHGRSVCRVLTRGEIERLFGRCE